jgi:hypothetical protein
MADAMGGGNMAQPTPEALAADAIDAAMGSAMDGAMDQGGAPDVGSDAEAAYTDGMIAGTEMGDTPPDEPDPSAGMG